MQVLRTVKDGKISLTEIMETNGLKIKKAKELVDLLCQQGYMEQGYTDTGRRSDTYELTRKGERTLKEYQKVEVMLLEHAPEILTGTG
jgi:predicted transcriptional regulator